MKVTITYDMGQAVGVEKFARFGVEEHTIRWRGYKTEINVKRWSPKMLREFAELLAPHAKVKGVPTLVRDLRAWADVISMDPTETRAKKVEHMALLLKEFLRKVPNHRVYEKDSDSDIWNAYYVNDITYHKPKREKDYDGNYYTVPPYITMQLMWIELGQAHTTRVTFEKGECIGATPYAMLVDNGYVPATAELEAMYDAEQERYERTVTNVGLQLLVSGTVTDDCDGNPKQNDSWWYRRTNAIRVDNEGEPAKMVVDVFVEDESKSDRNHHTSAKIQMAFWEDAKVKSDEDEEYDDSDDEVEIGEGEAREDGTTVRKTRSPVPTHPTLILFDLKRHLRVKAHLSQTMEYGYDPKVAAKLVLPDEVRDLVEILIAHNSAFNDVVKGKSGGAIILCAGVPGTGKTLTSEVYSEVMERPLYSVQASQLGHDPEELESELLKTFQRAKRWKAILLIDEADVYVRRRGDDLVQNSIVGVFLRVLEYYSGVMFMTTNRADLVDDAIASRCVARIDYQIPKPADQARIWRILARQADVQLTNEMIADIVLAYPNLSGRDIKNLVKLSTMISRTRNEPITVDTIRFVKQFKPTEATDIRDQPKHEVTVEEKARIVAELNKPERRARKFA